MLLGEVFVLKDGATQNGEGKEGVELYDYQTDPNEFTNLATNRKYISIVKELSAMLRKSYTSYVVGK